MQIVVST